MKVNKTVTLAMATPLFALLGAASTFAGEPQPTGYVMNFFEDSAQGAAVGDGAYENVIRELTKKDARGARRVADQVNLCVAYAKTGQLTKATEACDTALAIAGKRSMYTSSSGFYHAERNRIREERAITLINRGVLHAVFGDDDRATEMFETAHDLDADIDSAALNLLVLQRELVERDT
jgi:hypothetical protein